jgi:hypothetical protein
MPAADGLLHFAGEAISVRHAWVEGALDSAWRAVSELMFWPQFEKYREKFVKYWGVNPEWLHSRGTPETNATRLFDLDHSLLYKHLAISNVVSNRR